MTSPEIIPEPESDPSENEEVVTNLNGLTMRNFLDIAQWFNSTPEMLASATSFIKSGYPIDIGLQMLGITPEHVQSWQKFHLQQQQNIRSSVENIRSSAESNTSRIRKLGTQAIDSIRNIFH